MYTGCTKSAKLPPSPSAHSWNSSSAQWWQIWAQIWTCFDILRLNAEVRLFIYIYVADRGDDEEVLLLVEKEEEVGHKKILHSVSQQLVTIIVINIIIIINITVVVIVNIIKVYFFNLWPRLLVGEELNVKWAQTCYPNLPRYRIASLFFKTQIIKKNHVIHRCS